MRNRDNSPSAPGACLFSRYAGTPAGRNPGRVLCERTTGRVRPDIGGWDVSGPYHDQDGLAPAVVDLSVIEELHSRLERLARLTDPSSIAALSTELLLTLREVQQAVSVARDAAVLELHDGGNSLHSIARLAGLTRGRVFQIVQRGRDGGNPPAAVS
jgi:hypothetical protein